MKKVIIKIVLVLISVFTISFSSFAKIDDSLFARFGLTANEQNELKLSVTNFVDNYIKPDMSDFEKEMAIILYITLSAKNDVSGYFSNSLQTYALNAYGALVKGLCVCEGYADAFNLLCKAAGLTSEIVIGKAYTISSNGKAEFVNHSWNRVMLDNDWYNVDVAWDDLDDPSNFVFMNIYLNVTDEKLRVDHKWSGGRVCTAKKYDREAIKKYLFKGLI